MPFESVARRQMAALHWAGALLRLLSVAAVVMGIPCQEEAQPLAALAAQQSRKLSGAVCAPDPSDMATMVPFYVYPTLTATYQKLANYGSTCLVQAIITGSANGPPSIPSLFPDYNASFSLLANSGVILYGYVHAMVSLPNRQPRPLADIKAEIDEWYNRWGSLIKGIFVDEVVGNPVGVTGATFFSAVASYIQSHGGRVVFNPGAKLGCAVARYSDVYVRFEGPAASWNAQQAAGSIRCECSSVSSCSALIYSASASGAVQKLYNSAVADGFSYVYVTDDPATWSVLPTYWGAFMGVIQHAPSPKISAPLPVSAAPPQPSPKPPTPPAPSQLISPAPKPPPPPPPPSPPTATTGAWRPGPKTTWQWQLSGTNFVPALQTAPQMIDVDIDAYRTLTAQMANLGKSRTSIKVICYFSAGSYEPDRSTDDLSLRGINWPALRARYPYLTLTPLAPPWQDEAWLNITTAEMRQVLMDEVLKKRVDYAFALGCDGVEFDNVDCYSNDAACTVAHQLAYNMAMVDYAHSQGLSAGLKNALKLLPLRFPDGRAIVDVYDWYLNEECFAFDECDAYAAVPATAAVFGVEYCNGAATFGDSSLRNVRPDCFCPLALAKNNFNWLVKRVNLQGVGLACGSYCAKQACTAPRGGVVTRCYDKRKNICPLYGI